MRRKRILGALGVGVGAVAALLFSAPAASALAVTPVDGGVKVDFTHQDAQFVDSNKLGLALNNLPLNQYSSEGFRIGDIVNAAAYAASELPNGTFSVTVYGPLNDVTTHTEVNWAP